MSSKHVILIQAQKPPGTQKITVFNGWFSWMTPNHYMKKRVFHFVHPLFPGGGYRAANVFVEVSKTVWTCVFHDGSMGINGIFTTICLLIYPRKKSAMTMNEFVNVYATSPWIRHEVFPRDPITHRTSVSRQSSAQVKAQSTWQRGLRLFRHLPYSARP